MSVAPATVVTRVRPTASEAFPPINPVTLEAGFVSHLLGPQATQQDARRVIDPLTERFLCKLESVVVFAYGQTGSGKTHTILGPPGALTEVALESASPGQIPQEWGMFPAVALEVFRNLPPRSSLKVSVVEIYMDRVYDLLNNRESVAISGVGAKSQTNDPMQFLKTTSRDANGKWVNPFLAVQQQQEKARADGRKSGNADLALVSTTIGAEADVAKVSRLVEATRTTVSHNLNERSSRSHCIITLKYSTVNPKTSAIHTASFTFADLAGSERVKSSGVDADAHGGARSFQLTAGNSIDVPASRFDEAKNVNSSLASLSRLMVAIAAAKKQKPKAGGGVGHLPWRDSTLNLVLKDCFLSSAGSSAAHSSTPNMVLVMAVREDTSCEKETVSTYRFGKVVATTTGSSSRRATSVVVGMGSRNTGTTSTSTESQQQHQLLLDPSAFDAGSSTTTTPAGNTQHQPMESLEMRAQRLEQEKAALSALLQTMKGTAEEGGVNKKKGANVQQDFLRYQKILDDNTKMLKGLKQHLLEAKARHALNQQPTTSEGTRSSAPTAGGGGGTGTGEISVIQEQMEVCKHKIMVNEGLVQRMIYSGCYTAPSKKYTATLQQLKQVEQELTEFQ